MTPLGLTVDQGYWLIIGGAAVIGLGGFALGIYLDYRDERQGKKDKGRG